MLEGWHAWAQVPKVRMLIEKRNGKKTMTIISNLETFGIDPEVHHARARSTQDICASIVDCIPLRASHSVSF
jgi:translation initiation factor 1 (eIF-1/SUI1)